jgi:two-component system cell cycle sensor histidine kinase/response regulator CckA
MNDAAASITIMIIDDDPENRRVLRTMLSRQGYTVRSFPGGVPALQSAREDPPALILLDIRMPGMDGFEICTNLKADDSLRRIPVLFLSAVDEIDGKIRAFEVGGADFVTKPFQHEEVLTRIRTQLTIRQYQHELEEKTAQLDEQKRLYRRLIENIGDEYVIFSHTPEGVFTYMSPGSKALFKKGPEELVGKNWRDLNPTAECVAEMESLDENTVTTGIAPPTSLFHYYHPDGTMHTLEAENVPAFDESGRVIMIDGIAKDITKRLQLEMKLKAANENCQDMNIRLEELVQERTA